MNDTSTPSWKHYSEWLKTDLGKTSQPAPLPSDWCTDSRTVKPGQWFVPISGENFDGHRFIKSALAAGAAGFLFEKASRNIIEPELLKKGIAVENSLASYQGIASGWRTFLGEKITLSAMTGSAGKTTCNALLGSMLTKCAPSYVPHRSLNNEVGVPYSLLQMNHQHKYAALEFGARHIGDISFLIEMASPNVRTLLNVGTAHIGEFGSIENILKGKLEMFSGLSPDTHLVGYHDDPRIAQVVSSSGHSFSTFGQGTGATVRILASKIEGSSTYISLAIDDREHEFVVPTIHSSLSMNLAAACAIARALGVEVEYLKQGAADFRGSEGRFQIEATPFGTLVDDSYNANPESMSAGLNTIKTGFPTKKAVYILGTMLERGTSSEKDHRQVGRECLSNNNLVSLVTVGKEARFIGDAALAEGWPPEKWHAFETADELIEKLSSPTRHDILPTESEIVFVKASNSIGLSSVVQWLRNQS